MADPRFYPTPEATRAADLARRFELTLRGADRVVTGVAPLSLAGPGDVAFVAGKAHLDAAGASEAGVLIAPETLAGAFRDRTVIVSDTPQRTYAAIARTLYPDAAVRGGVSGAAHVDPTAKLGRGVAVAPGAVIGSGADIGAGCEIGAGAVVGAGVVLGEDCRIGARAVVQFALLGARVRVFAGAVIGEDGFGFVAGPAGLEKIPQLGRVVIGDDVEIGANTTIDRGAGEDTVIGTGTKIDNLVQVAHNVRIGAHCVIVSQAGIAGSTVLGDGVQMAGKAAIADHLTVGSGARIAGGSGVTRNVGPGETVAGYPAVPVRDWHRQTVALSRLIRRDG